MQKGELAEGVGSAAWRGFWQHFCRFLVPQLERWSISIPRDEETNAAILPVCAECTGSAATWAELLPVRSEAQKLNTFDSCLCSSFQKKGKFIIECQIFKIKNVLLCLFQLKCDIHLSLSEPQSGFTLCQTDFMLCFYF